MALSRGGTWCDNVGQTGGKCRQGDGEVTTGAQGREDGGWDQGSG